MSKSLTRWLTITVVIAILAIIALSFTHYGARTKEQMETHLLQMLKDNVSVPVPGSPVTPTIDINPVRTANGEWNLEITTTSFRLVGEAGNQQAPASGYIYLFLDGKPLSSIATRSYNLGMLEGRHVVAAGLQDENRYLYRINAKTLSKVIEGDFTEQGFVLRAK